MSTDHDKKSKTEETTGSSSGKQAPPNDSTGSKTTDSQNVPPSTGHEVTGVEKFVEAGGSGGATVHTDHGYESLAHH